MLNEREKVVEEEIVRLKPYSESSINSHAMVCHIKKDRILLSNTSFERKGTIRKYFTKQEFEALTDKTF